MNWAYVLECYDRRSGVLTREWYMFPADARHRREQLLSSGFYSVTIRPKRIKAFGQPTTLRAGIYDLGR